MSSMPLKDNVVAVTGASSGFGQVIAETLGRAGAHVFMCGRSTEPMEATKAEIEKAGGGATLCAFDMRDVSAVEKFVKGAAAHSERLNVFVNNAGLGYIVPIADGNPEHWREMLEVNVLGLLVGCKAAIGAMRDTGSMGRIINISSIAAIRRDSGVYGATKHAVNCINATLRTELEDEDIRVTSIMPGVFGTNFVRNMDPALVTGMMEMAGMEVIKPDNEGKFPREAMEEVQQKMSSIVGDPQAIADAVLYVATQPASINIEEMVVRPPKAMAI